MKTIYLPLAIATVITLFSGCSHSPVGVPGKEIILPAESGKSLPAGGFTALNGNWAAETTEVFVQKTEKSVIFEFVCYGNPEQLRWSEKKKDDDMTLFGGEHVELFLAPQGMKNGAKHYHIALNPSGSIYHAIKHDTTWNPEVICKTEIKKDHWRAVIEVPISLMEADGKTESLWNVNFCRTISKKGSSPEHTSWTGATNYHYIPTMGQLHFSGKEPSDHLRIFRCRTTEQQTLDLEFVKTGKTHAYLQIFDDGKLIDSKKITSDKEHRITINLSKGFVPLKDTKDISIYLLGPYRIPIQKFSGNVKFYQTPFLQLDRMEYSKESELICSAAVFPGKIIIKNDQEIFREINAVSQKTNVSLKDLEPGRYVLEYHTEGNWSSRVFFIAPETPQAVPELPENGKLSVKGNDLLLDGKPFFLLGISGTPKTFYPQQPDFTLNYGKGGRKNALPHRGFPGKRLVRKPVTGYAFHKNWENLVANYLQGLKKQKKLTWNLLCYEATLPVLTYDSAGDLQVAPNGCEFYREIYKMAKKELPEAVFSIHVDNILEAEEYVESCDVLEYACWNSSYHQSNMIRNFGTDFDHVRELAGEKPLIPWLGGTIPAPENRTAEEIRAGIYYTILKGGTGNIIHMGHGGMPEQRTRFWSMLSMLSREVESFYQDFKTWKEVELPLPENLIGKTVKGPNGEYLTVILNTTPAEIRGNIKLPGTGSAMMTFTPFEPRVIRFTPKPAK